MILLRRHIKQSIAAVRRGISSKESSSFSNNCRKEVEEAVWGSVFSHLELLLLCLIGDRATVDGSHHSFCSSSPEQAVPADRHFIQSLVSSLTYEAFIIPPSVKRPVSSFLHLLKIIHRHQRRHHQPEEECLDGVIRW